MGRGIGPRFTVDLNCEIERARCRGASVGLIMAPTFWTWRDMASQCVGPGTAHRLLFEERRRAKSYGGALPSPIAV